MSAVDPVKEVAVRLAEILGALAALPDGPSSARYQLLTERDELRARAAKFVVNRDASRLTTELESELDSLRRRRDQAVRSRTGFAMGMGGSNQGPVGGAWVKLGVQALSGGELGWVNTRISAIEDVLRERREAIPDRT
jgi:hypothetical protein